MKKLVIIAALMLSFVINCSQKNSEPETPKPVLTELQEQEPCGYGLNEGCNAEDPNGGDFESINCNGISLL